MMNNIIDTNPIEIDDREIIPEPGESGKIKDFFLSIFNVKMWINIFLLYFCRSQWSKSGDLFV